MPYKYWLLRIRFANLSRTNRDEKKNDQQFEIISNLDLNQIWTIGWFISTQGLSRDLENVSFLSSVKSKFLLNDNFSEIKKI